MTDDGSKVVSFPARPWPPERDRHEASRRMHLRVELAEVLKGAIDQMRKLGGTSDEIAAQLESAVQEVRMRR